MMEKQLIPSVLQHNPMWQETAPYVLPEMAWDDPAYGRRNLKPSQARKHITTTYAWAIASPDALFYVSQQADGKLIDMGAGTGYWAAQLAQLEVDVVAYDTCPPHEKDNIYFPGRYIYYAVQPGGPEVLTQYVDRTLFLSWPSFDTSFAAECLQTYCGNKLIYIGEHAGGCTGDDTFFELLERDWQAVDCYSLPQWEGIYDYIFVYERKYAIIKGERVEEQPAAIETEKNQIEVLSRGELEQARVEAGLTIAQLSKVSNVSRATIEKMERGEAVRAEFAARVCRVISRYLGHEVIALHHPIRTTKNHPCG